jgi:uncharacterized protein (DUF1786 family)
MRLLAVDVGTGTQDILLFDSDLEVENCFKLVMPSPTMIVARMVKAATRRGDPLLLTGVTMGGGPSTWATRDHAQAGYAVYATPDAARSFNDDLDAVVTEMGIQIVNEDEAVALRRRDGIRHVKLKDFDFPVIVRAFETFGLDPAQQHKIDVVAVAVFDHGNAPPGYSDRQFRFDYLTERLQRGEETIVPPSGAKRSERGERRERCGEFSTFAFRAEHIPPIMTRMQAVADGYAADGVDAPLMVMDTAPAAVLGALLDPQVGQREQLIVANVGNFHTLAFRLGPERIEGMFEHHTGLIDQVRLDDLVAALADGTLTHEAVFDDHGHGALLCTRDPMPLDFLGVTGPRRNLLRTSRHSPYLAVPYGDMMIAGCFGLARACADLMPEWAEEILESLDGVERGAPWEYL